MKNIDSIHVLYNNYHEIRKCRGYSVTQHISNLRIFQFNSVKSEVVDKIQKNYEVKF